MKNGCLICSLNDVRDVEGGMVRIFVLLSDENIFLLVRCWVKKC